MFDSPSELIENNSKKIESIWHADLYDQTDYAIKYSIARACAGMMLNFNIDPEMFHDAMDDEMEFRAEIDKETEEE